MLLIKAMIRRKWFPFLLVLGLLGYSNSLWGRSVTVDDSSETEILVTLRVELCPKPKDDPDTPEKEGPSLEDLQNFIEAHQEAVTRMWNPCPKRVRMRRGTPLKNIRFAFEISAIEDCEQEKDPDKKRYQVHLGMPPPESGKNADNENLWLENTDRSVAHEFGHSMGLEDEYSQFGGNRENIMGSGTGEKFERILTYHIISILFNNVGTPDRAEENRRILMESMLRMKDQKTARKIAADNGITKEQYDAYKDMFTVNGTEVQPGRPE